MKKEEILNTIKSLAGSQGFYSRIYQKLMEMGESERERVLVSLEEMNFKDPVDLIFYFEC